MRYSPRAPKQDILLRNRHNNVRLPLRNVASAGKDENEYFQNRIAELEGELRNLNILEHPLQIVDICSELRILKAAITRL